MGNGDALCLVEQLLFMGNLEVTILRNSQNYNSTDLQITLQTVRALFITILLSNRRLAFRTALYSTTLCLHRIAAASKNGGDNIYFSYAFSHFCFNTSARRGTIRPRRPWPPFI